ncbi:MAG TPA: o-succinylbenzoate--CoA ligase [Chloroflexota bacterium]|nr:o-succinylbenzoate--CoA ligase [Chloroflexota bacterium]
MAMMEAQRDWLVSRVQTSPAQTALLMGERQWSYAELNRLVNGCCARLAALGVQPGELVGVLLPNSLVYVCLIHALARMGAVLAPLNTRLTPAEWQWQAAHVGCRLVLCEPERAATTGQSIRLVAVDETWLSPEPAAWEARPLPLHGVQAVVFTSGTSGRPKGAQLTFANHFYSAMASAYRVGVLPDDLWLSCLPLYHVGGLAVIWRSCLYGTAVDLHPKFDLTAVNDSLNHKPITLISLVPTMLAWLLESRSEWPETLRLALIGGAALAPDLLAAALAAGVPIATTYGLTEAASQVATMRPDEVRRKPGSVGRPLLFTSARIVDDDGRELPPDEIGEIVVSGPTVMVGYFGEDALTNRSFHTGDMGYVDADGDLWVVQRRSDLIVSGGENVYPAEVEAVLKSHTAVAAACVVGLPDGEWGQVVAAAVVVKEGTAVTAAELTQFCRERLAGYKLPRQIFFVPDLPLTASGKIARQEVVQNLAMTRSGDF